MSDCPCCAAKELKYYGPTEYNNDRILEEHALISLRWLIDRGMLIVFHTDHDPEHGAHGSLSDAESANWNGSCIQINVEGVFDNYKEEE